MIPSPCLNPIRVYNRALRDYIHVPCGHCEACICSKGKYRSDRLEQSVARYTNKFFVTLTFNDDYLPIAHYDELTNCYIHPFDCDYNAEVYKVDAVVVGASLVDADFRASFEKYNGVPVLSRRLIINFKKRLRKKFAKIYGKEYLFIYVVGEYGPTTYRPHYHVVLCTNAKCTTSAVEKCVRESWADYNKATQTIVSQYGEIDFQRIISNGVHNYAAAYVNCTTHLPACLASTLFRPFSQSSPLIHTDTLRYRGSEVEELYFRCTPETTHISLVDGSSSVELYPLCLVNRVFPRCLSFSLLSHSDRVSLYRTYTEQPFKSADAFAEGMMLCYPSSSSSIGICKVLCVDNDVQASKLRLKRMFYMSRRVCLNASKLHVSMDDYVTQLELFWSRYELVKLRKFYEMQESLLEDKFNPISLPYLFTLYYDTSEKLRHLDYYIEQFKVDASYSVNAISKQCEYSSLVRKILLDSTKTKKRNDVFRKNGWKRPNYLLTIKSKKSCLRFSQI